MQNFVKFIEQSHEWVSAIRGRDIMRLASHSLADCFGLDSGLFVYKKRATRLDIQEGNWSIRAPWGEFANLWPSSLPFTADEWSLEFLRPYLNRWIPKDEWERVSDVFPCFGPTLLETDLQQCSAWPLCSGGNFVGFLVVATQRSTGMPEPAIMKACAGQIIAFLDTALVRFQSEVAQAFIKNSVDATTTLDLDGTLLGANPAFQDMFGWDNTEVIGVKTPIATNALRKQFHEFVNDAKIGKQFTHVKGFIKHKDGRKCPVLMTWFAIRNGNGDLNSIGSIIRDISEIKRLTHELNSARFMYESLFKNTADAIAILDNDGRVQRVNPAYERLTGWRAKAVVGRFPRTIPDGAKTEFLYDLKQVRQGTQIVGKRATWKRQDGGSYHVSLTMSPVLDKADNINRISVIQRDITNEVETEESLRRSDKLAIAGTLAASVAHEIRNPLTTVKGFLQLLEPEFSHRAREYQLIQSEIAQMERIINEFLLLAKPSQVNVTEVKIDAMMRDITALMQAEANMYNVEIYHAFTESPILRCDAAALKQVFVNLMKNSIDAFESMKTGGRIQVAIETDNHSNIQIRISDNGPGMTQEQIAKLGEPFYTTKEKGTGLGLMVCRRIIMNLNGELDVQSQMGVGTTVTVTLPIRKAAQPKVPR